MIERWSKRGLSYTTFDQRLEFKNIFKKLYPTAQKALDAELINKYGIETIKEINTLTHHMATTGYTLQQTVNAIHDFNQLGISLEGSNEDDQSE